MRSPYDVAVRKSKHHPRRSSAVADSFARLADQRSFARRRLVALAANERKKKPEASFPLSSSIYGKEGVIARNTCLVLPSFRPGEDDEGKARLTRSHRRLGCLSLPSRPLHDCSHLWWPQETLRWRQALLS